MPHLPFEGNFRVWWAAGSAVADKQAPTVAEIGAMQEITSEVPRDGLSTNPTFNQIDTATLEDAFNSEQQGTWGMNVDLAILLDSDSSTIEDLFDTHATSGFLVIIPYSTASSPAAGEKAYVIPGDAAIGIPDGTAQDTRQQNSLNIAIEEPPALDATVAA